MYKPLIICLLSLLLLAGCASAPISQPPPTPVRPLTATVVCESLEDQPRIESSIRDANTHMVSEVGVELQPVTWIQHHFKNRLDRTAALVELWKLVDHPKTDLVIGFMRIEPLEWAGRQLLSAVTMGENLGVIDDTQRRYIVLFSWDWHIIKHELGHAFIVSHAHSGSGIMSELMPFKLLPFLPIIYTEEWFCERDREEVIQHRWRDFSKMINVAGPDKLEAKETRSTRW